MQLIPEYRGDVPRVERFNLHSRVTHWGHTITFIICLLSGLILFLNGSWLAVIFGGTGNAGSFHKVFAVAMTFFVLYFVVFNFKTLVFWVKDILRFGIRDIIFIAKFPLEFLGFEVKTPRQTKFNGGEKGNSIVTSTCVLLLMISGYMMWFPEYFSVGTIVIAYIVHDIAMVIAACMVCMHAYLGSLHPHSGESFWGMWKGTVQEDWAKHHHKIWYDENYLKK